MKVVREVKVKNVLGLHIRPATSIVRLLQVSKSSVHFTYKKVNINARSIMSILMLVAKKNSKIIITVEGADAIQTMDQLMCAFENRFGEDK